MGRVEWLKELDGATEEVLDQIKSNKETIEGAINWADLHCAEARWILNHEGMMYAEVLIEEAAPGSVNLMLRVQEDLESMGFGKVSVVTEW